MSRQDPFVEQRQAVQEALILRLHAVLLPMAVILVALRSGRGLQVLLPGGILIAYLGLGLWRAQRGKRWGVRRAYGLLILLSSFELYWGLAWPDGGLPPILALLASTGLLLQLCWSSRAGWTAFGLGLLIMALVRAFKGPFTPRQDDFFMDMGLTMLGLQATAWAYDQVLERAHRALSAQHDMLGRLSLARGRLVSALLDNLELPLQWAGRARFPDQDLAQQLSTGLAEARKLRESMDLVEGDGIDPQISQRLLTPLLGLGIVIATVVGLRDLLSHQADAAIGLGLAAVLGILLALLRRWPGGWPRVAGATLLAAFAAFCAAVWTTPTGIVPGALTFGALLIAFAAFWLGMRAAIVALAGMLALAGWVLWGRGGALSHSENNILVNFMEQWVSLAFIIAPAVEAQASLLQRLDRQAVDLAANLRVQRRLLGTLFHDAANHVMALGGLAALAAQEPEGPNAERFERLLGRLGRLVSSARDWLYLDKPFEPAQLQSMPADGLAHAMEDLFEERLKGKQLSLATDLPPRLSLLGVPALLSDGVLGNLVSNAIKFSPRGAQILLQGGSDEGYAWLAVLDQGPGLPEGLVDALRRHEDLASRHGTEGETGQGLGLGLAREHLKRMGGRLELRPRAGGGTEARIWLPLSN